MALAEILAPVSVEELKRDYFGRQCLLIKRKKSNPLSYLLTPEQLEARLNDGVATNAGLNIIQKDGTKLDPRELVCTPEVPSWAGRFTRKAKVRALLEDGASFVLHNMSALTPAIEALIAEIEQTFHAHADVHVYTSPQAGATGYNAHKDEPQHKLYLQLFGSTDWVIYQKSDPRVSMPAAEAARVLGVDFRATLTPGSVLYMPPGVFHHATNPETPRISLSIPFYNIAGAQTVDRTHIPLAQWLKNGVA